jgi:hypothetical protein
VKTKSVNPPSIPLSSYHDAHTFIVRVWQDQRENLSNQPAWKGQISHVGSGRQRYFLDLKDILGFIQEYTRLRVPVKISWWQALINRIRSNER